MALSKDSRKYFERYRSHSLVGDDMQLQQLKAAASLAATASPTTDGNNVLPIPQQQMEESKFCLWCLGDYAAKTRLSIKNIEFVLREENRHTLQESTVQG